MKRRSWGFAILVLIVFFACSPSEKIREEVALALTETQTVLPANNERVTISPGSTQSASETPRLEETPSQAASIPPSATLPNYPPPGLVLTPSATRTAAPAATLSATQAPTETGTQTLSSTPTGTQIPSATPSPTITPSPTPTITPVLPGLEALLVDSAALNQAVNIWQPDARDISHELRDLGGAVCQVECVGLRWESTDLSQSLTLVIYRTPDFPVAAQTAFSAQSIYLNADFELVGIPPGNHLPSHAWSAQKAEREFVIFTSQGPAVISFFWRAGTVQDPNSVVSLLARYAGDQSLILRDHGFITTNPQATPLP